MFRIIVGVVCTFAVGELGYRYGSANNLVLLLGAAATIIGFAITLTLMMLTLEPSADGQADDERE